MSSILFRTALLTTLLVIGTTACPRRAVHDPAPGATTTVSVQNDRFLSFVVYAIRGGERIRLGTVGGNRTRVFAIPSDFLYPGSTPLRFEARQIGGRMQPISEEFELLRGDHLRLVLSSGPTADLRRGT